MAPFCLPFPSANNHLAKKNCHGCIFGWSSQKLKISRVFCVSLAFPPFSPGKKPPKILGSERPEDPPAAHRCRARCAKAAHLWRWTPHGPGRSGHRISAADTSSKWQSWGGSRINIKMVQPDFHENGIDLRKIRDLWVSKKIADLGVEHAIFLDSSKKHLEFLKSWVPKSPWLFLKFWSLKIGFLTPYLWKSFRLHPQWGNSLRKTMEFMRTNSIDLKKIVIWFVEKAGQNHVILDLNQYHWKSCRFRKHKWRCSPSKTSGFYQKKRKSKST
jgi:hypothetical protein